jgi:hypothetical protein
MISNYPLLEAQKDVKICVEVWKEFFETYFANKIEYAYVKGSATKKWETEIDYVPILSDVDIHLKIKEGVMLFSSNNKFEESMNINEKYEESFIKKNPNYLHIPRPQVLELNSRISNADFILTSEISKDCILVGKPEIIKKRPREEIQALDLKMLLNLQDLINNLPITLMDRSGIDYITLIRRLSYEVSPSPVRLLSQLEEDPYKIWDLNRTGITQKLVKNGYSDLAESYINYYKTGWEVFRSGFKNTSLMRSLLLKSYEVLSKSLNYGQKINQNN